MDDVERRLTALRPQLYPSIEATSRARDAVLDAHAKSFKRRVSRRPLRAITAIAVLALLAAPAYALVTHVIDFSHTTKAPTVIKKRFKALFVSGAPPKMDPQAIVSATRLVTTFRVGGQQFPLWVAPTATGHVCAEFLGYAGGCTAAVVDPHPDPGEVAPWGLNLMVGAISHHNYLAGIITAQLAFRLELELNDGTTRPISFVWVSDPINAGFFMTSLPPNEATVQPVALKLLDDAGHVIAESSQVQSPPGPRSLSR